VVHPSPFIETVLQEAPILQNSLVCSALVE
jgi:hypothetical protein